MPRYIVSAPVTVTVSWTVDAPDAEAAQESEFGEDIFFVPAGGGISANPGCRLSAPESDNIDWDRVDVAEDDS